MRVFLLLLLAASLPSIANELSVLSPDKKVKLSFTDDGELAQYRVSFNGEPVLGLGKLGFTFAKAAPLYRDFKVEEISRNTVDQTWQQPWGEQRDIRDNHNELLVKFYNPSDKDRTFLVRARVFNDGIGFRYELPASGNRIITRELTEFNLVDSHQAKAFWIPAHGRDRYEYVYQSTNLQDVHTAHTPFTVKYENGTHVAIHEAALVDYAGMSLKRQELGRFTASLAPRHDGSLVHKTGSFVTPWRTITLGNDATDLVNSYLVLNLNEPNKLGDVSWVEPGKYIGIWWGMHIDEYTWGSGDKHGATTQRTKQYMDFAAKHGFDGVLVEGWNKGWDGDWIANSELFSFTESYPDFDIEAVTSYGEKVGVKLIGHHETSGGITNYEAQMEDGFALYNKLGVSQIKTGYVAHGQNLKVRDDNNVLRYEYTDSQDVVNHFIKNVTTAAKYQLSINTHESVKDTGLRRTYPNWISRESARGQEYNSGWAAPNPPNHIPMLAFTRMLAGPMDFTPGIFNFDYIRKNDGGIEWGKGEVMRPQTTLAKQLAQYVVLYSPIQMAADLPRNYENNLPAFQFIKDVPTDWSHSKALQGEVGEYIVMARKASKQTSYSENDWFVGAITNEEARELSLPLTFLEEGQQYEAQLYLDGEKAHWKTNPYAMNIEKKVVTSADVLSFKLAPSGGGAIRFKLLSQ